MTKTPRFGHTKSGLAVHGRTIDHHQGGFNKAIAVLLTAKVGSMRCFWVFCVLALLSLPATLHEAGAVGAHWLGIPSFFMSFGFIFLDAWVCQNFIQLVLLPALMVGQNLQNAASDARTAKQFEDTETIADRLDTKTRGGLTDVLTEVRAVRQDLSGLASAIGGNFAADKASAGAAPLNATVTVTDPAPAAKAARAPRKPSL